MFWIQTIAKVTGTNNMFETQFDTSLLFDEQKPGEFESLPVNKRTYQQELYLIERKQSQQRRQDQALENFFKPLTVS